MRTSGEVTIDIDADAMTLYGLVADVTKIGGFSPECRKARWQRGSSTALPGSRFRGDNVARRWIRWSRDCEVLTAEPGHAFSFRTIPTAFKRDSTVWTYRFDEGHHAGCTTVTESYDVVKLPPAAALAMIRRLLPHHLDMRPNMQRTLEALKAAAEAVGHPSARPLGVDATEPAGKTGSGHR